MLKGEKCRNERKTTAGASLEVMDTDAKRMRGDRPFVFMNLKEGHGVTIVAEFIETHGLLTRLSPNKCSAVLEASK
jgi:hypothetical protein